MSQPTEPTGYQPFLGHPMVWLAPGVVGYTRDDPDGALVIPMVIAHREGAGDVGRYLDALPRTRKVIVEAVTNVRLAGMLARRGFLYVERAAYEPDVQEVVDGWVRWPNPDPPAP